MYGNTIKGEVDLGKDVTKGSYSYGLFFHHNTVGWDSPMSVSTCGLQMEQTVQGLIVAHNTFKNLDCPIWMCQYNYADDYVDDVWIQANLMYNCGMSSSSSGWGIRFESGSNIRPQYYDNINIWNNTIVAYTSFPGRYGIELPTHASVTNTMNINVSNNIIKGFITAGIYGRDQSPSSAPAIDQLTLADNNLYGCGNSNDPLYSGFTPTNYTITGAIKTDPLFVSSSNFHLTASSPGVGNGTNKSIPQDLDGVAYLNPPSCGCYEYGSAPIPPTPVSSITVIGSGGVITITIRGGTLQIIETVLPADATDKTVTWSVTAGTGTATISATGLLTALTNGTVTVRATANDGSAVYGEVVITIENQIPIPVTPGKSIAPSGWHIPTYNEMEALRSFLDPINSDPNANYAGGPMKSVSATHWNPPNSGATNSSGFNAIGAGTRSGLDGSFSSEKDATEFWNNNDATLIYGG